MMEQHQAKKPRYDKDAKRQKNSGKPETLTKIGLAVNGNNPIEPEQTALTQQQEACFEQQPPVVTMSEARQTASSSIVTATVTTTTTEKVFEILLLLLIRSKLACVAVTSLSPCMCDRQTFVVTVCVVLPSSR